MLRFSPSLLVMSTPAPAGGTVADDQFPAPLQEPLAAVQLTTGEAAYVWGQRIGQLAATRALRARFFENERLRLRVGMGHALFQGMLGTGRGGNDRGGRTKNSDFSLKGGGSGFEALR